MRPGCFGRRLKPSNGLRPSKRRRRAVVPDGAFVDLDPEPRTLRWRDGARDDGKRIVDRIVLEMTCVRLMPQSRFAIEQARWLAAADPRLDSATFAATFTDRPSSI